MSEYQYYEFQAVDRPLTQKQMEELRRYSSRARITSSSFINVYNYGDFGGDPDELMEKYFDAFLYLANWGTRWLMLRLPKTLLDPKTAATYSAGDYFSCRQQGGHLILSLRSEDEEAYEWVDGEGWLGSLIPLRAALMRGDHRALYLGWLLAVQNEEIDGEALEPPVPPGLAELDASLTRLADFLRIDPDLIATAAEQSAAGSNPPPSKNEIADWAAKLPNKAKDTLLAKLIANDDPQLLVKLQRQALDSARGAAPHSSAPRRTAADLLERARVLSEIRREQEAAERSRQQAKQEREAAERRKKHLESLRGKETSLWSQVRQLIAIRQPKRYDEAVALLIDLRDLAEIRGETGTFQAKMAALHEEHARKTTLIERFRKARLIA